MVPILRMRTKIPGRSTQAMIDAIVAGNLDNPDAATLNRDRQGVTYAQARADVVAQFNPSSLPQPNLIDEASHVLYHEISKRPDGASAGVDPIKIMEGDFPQAEIVAVMSLFLFFGRLVRPSLDVRYTFKDPDGRSKHHISTSDLLWVDTEFGDTLGTSFKLRSTSCSHAAHFRPQNP